MPEDPSNFPQKKFQFKRILLDLEPEKKDDIVLNLLCNILLQTRENYELLHYICRQTPMPISGFLKKQIADSHEADVMQLSKFLAKWAQDVDLQRPKIGE